MSISRYDWADLLRLVVPVSNNYGRPFLWIALPHQYKLVVQSVNSGWRAGPDTMLGLCEEGGGENFK